VNNRPFEFTPRQLLIAAILLACFLGYAGEMDALDAEKREVFRAQLEHDRLCQVEKTGC
jgi:hypothetical protein